MSLGRDGLIGVIGVVISAVLLVQSFGLQRLPLTPVGPGFYPRIVLAFMALVSAALLWQDWRQRRRVEDDLAGAMTGWRLDGRVVLSFAVTGAYVVLLPLLGFRLATALFVAVFQYVIDPPQTVRQWLTLAGVAIGTTVVGYLVFETYLLVLLPRGAWSGW